MPRSFLEPCQDFSDGEDAQPVGLSTLSYLPVSLGNQDKRCGLGNQRGRTLVPHLFHSESGGLMLRGHIVRHRHLSCGTGSKS